MPTKSKKQHGFMIAMVRTGSPKQKKMAAEFLREDAKGGKFKAKKKKSVAKKKIASKKKKK